MSKNQADQSWKDRFERIAAAAMRFVQRPEKLFLLILVAGTMTILGSVWYWKINVGRSFAVNQLIKEQQQRQSEQSVADFNQLLAEQRRDTDGDGLSDWEEIYIYKTSPYLADSDSDGISDKEEIERGTDPNCPEGQDCRFIIPGATGDNLADSIIPNLPEVDYDSKLGGEIRQILLSYGLEAELLDQVTDTELVQIYQQLVSSGELVGEQSAEIEQSQNIEAAELRQALLLSGVDPNILDNLTDQQLLDLNQQTLESLQN